MAGLILMSLAGFAALGIGAYRLAAAGPAWLDLRQITENKLGSEFSATQGSGVVEGVVLKVAHVWIMQNLIDTDVRQIAKALACFDEIGGPAPLQILGYAKSKITDERVVMKIDALLNGWSKNQEDRGNHDAGGTTGDGPAACAAWLISA
jgi:hypothetical protein